MDLISSHHVTADGGVVLGWEGMEEDFLLFLSVQAVVEISVPSGGVLGVVKISLPGLILVIMEMEFVLWFPSRGILLLFCLSFLISPVTIITIRKISMC